MHTILILIFCRSERLHCAAFRATTTSAGCGELKRGLRKMSTYFELWPAFVGQSSAPISQNLWINFFANDRKKDREIFRIPEKWRKDADCWVMRVLKRLMDVLHTHIKGKKIASKIFVAKNCQHVTHRFSTQACGSF